MPLVDPERFDGKDVAVVYITNRLSEAKLVEKVLSDNGIDYAVDNEPFQNLVLGIFPVEYEGVGFYVLSGQAEFCRGVLQNAGLVRGLMVDDVDKNPDEQ